MNSPQWPSITPGLKFEPSRKSWARRICSLGVAEGEGFAISELAKRRVAKKTLCVARCRNGFHASGPSIGNRSITLRIRARCRRRFHVHRAVWKGRDGERQFRRILGGSEQKLKDFAEPFVFAAADYLQTHSQQSSKSQPVSLKPKP